MTKNCTNNQASYEKKSRPDEHRIGEPSCKAATKKKVKQKNKVVLMFPLPSPIKEMPRIGAPRNELAPFGRAGKGDGGPISTLEVITGPEMKMTLKGVDGKLKMAIIGIFQGNLNRSSGAQDMLCQYLAEWDKSLAIVRPHFPIGERRQCEGEDTHRCASSLVYR